MKKFILLLLALIFASCSDDSSTSATKIYHRDVRVADSLKIALILPLSETNSSHWERSAKWFSENLKVAFEATSLDSSFVFEFEWIDEDSADMDSVGEALAKNDAIKAVIGPLNSENLDTVAHYMIQAKKTIIAPMATSTEVVRKYVSEKYFFSLSETDAAQTEILLNHAVSRGAKSVALLSTESSYGQTFIDWFAFQATELNLDIKGLYTYNTNSQFTEVAKQAFDSNSDYIICVPNNYSEVEQYIKLYKASGSKSHLLFSNRAHDRNILNYEDVEGLEGISMGSNPESGFDVAYFAKFGEYPIGGEAQLYDALMLAAFAQMNIWLDESMPFHTAYAKAGGTDSSGTDLVVWESSSMARVLEDMTQNIITDIAGTSGNLDFFSKKEHIALSTSFTHWKVDKNRIMPIEYLAFEGSKRRTESTSSSNWYSSILVGIQDSINPLIPTTELKGSYALLISTSRDWVDYRHQADVLSMYNKLKAAGMNDDHIVLILEDNLVNHPLNWYSPGALLDYEGKSIHDNVKVDYKFSDLLPEDIAAILSGKKDERLTKVIEADSNYNVFVFWSGHGTSRGFNWKTGEIDTSFTYNHMDKLLKQMKNEDKFRKMLWIVETCYSGKVCKAFEKNAIPGTLCISAANEYETSKNDMYNSDYGIYMTNSFTKNFFHSIDEVVYKNAGDISIYDLYNYAAKNTLGSHASIYNANNYENLRTCGIWEYFPYKTY